MEARVFLISYNTLFMFSLLFNAFRFLLYMLLIRCENPFVKPSELIL